MSWVRFLSVGGGLILFFTLGLKIAIIALWQRCYCYLWHERIAQWDAFHNYSSSSNATQLQSHHRFLKTHNKTTTNTHPDFCHCVIESHTQLKPMMGKWWDDMGTIGRILLAVEDKDIFWVHGLVLAWCQLKKQHHCYACHPKKFYDSQNVCSIIRFGKKYVCSLLQFNNNNSSQEHWNTL